jgi:hypothetical protein
LGPDLTTKMPIKNLQAICNASMAANGVDHSGCADIL